MKHFIYQFTSILHGLIRTHKWPAPRQLLGVLYLWAGSCYTFFLACVTIRTNFLKRFAVRAVGNALQPQISVIDTRAVTCAQNQWQKHYTKLKHLLQRSIAHKVDVEMLKEIFKKSQCFCSNLLTKSMIKYTSYKKLRSLLPQLLSCKISYKIQLKNLKYLSP